MQDDRLPKKEDVKVKLGGFKLTEPTAIALEERIEKFGKNCFFKDDEFLLLSQVSDLLVDQNSAERTVEIALFIDERLNNKESDGWRYDSMPPDHVMYHWGLKGIEDTALHLFNSSFCHLTQAQQKEILTAIQSGAVEAEIWPQMNAKLFFEELLAEVTEIFFSHPLVQYSINYVGMADADGWKNIGLDQVVSPEAKPPIQS